MKRKTLLQAWREMLNRQGVKGKQAGNVQAGNGGK